MKNPQQLKSWHWAQEKTPQVEADVEGNRKARRAFKKVIGKVCKDADELERRIVELRQEQDGLIAAIADNKRTIHVQEEEIGRLQEIIVWANASKLVKAAEDERLAGELSFQDLKASVFGARED